jgi:RHS repeat-associated protein
MDGHSGVRILTDKLGNLTDTSSYDAYGNSTGSVDSEFGYRGESFDDLTGLQYLRARYYDPSNGRFLGVDPIEGDMNSPVSRHRYLYGNANPVSYSDPSGKFSIGEASAAVAVVSILSTLGQIGAINYLYNQSDGRDLNWNGTIQTAGFSSSLFGIDSDLGATLAQVSLISDCYENKITRGI